MKSAFDAVLRVSVCVICMCSAVEAGGLSAQMAQVMEGLDADAKTTVIISLSADPGKSSPALGANRKLLRKQQIHWLKERAAQSRRSIKALLNDEGITDIADLWSINSVAIKAGPSLIASLAQRPEVIDIRPDIVLSMPDTNYAAETTPQWNIQRVEADSLWEIGHTGQGVTVAIMDTGVDLHHPDLAPKWRAGSNSWYDPHGQYSQPTDTHGHGTQVMGIIVGGDNSGTAIGVAPDAQWIAVKLFDDDGETSLSKIHMGFQWLLDPDNDPNTDDAPDVVNNSWGLRGNIDQCVLEFRSSIEMLKNAGIAVVFSAGNEGPNPATSISPANYDVSYAVGSVDSLNVIANSSSRGPSPCHGKLFPDVAAPGVSIKTSDLTANGVFPDTYAYVSGTSFAAPHVAGAMALLLSAFPQLDVTTVETTLSSSAVDLGIAGGDYNYGNGLINISSAYQLLIDLTCPADINGDGVVDVGDIAIMATHWLQTSCFCQSGCSADLTGDGSVDLNDFALLGQMWMEGF